MYNGEKLTTLKLFILSKTYNETQTSLNSNFNQISHSILAVLKIVNKFCPDSMSIFLSYFMTSF